MLKQKSSKLHLILNFSMRIVYLFINPTAGLLYTTIDGELHTRYQSFFTKARKEAFCSYFHLLIAFYKYIPKEEDSKAIGANQIWEIFFYKKKNKNWEIFFDGTFRVVPHDRQIELITSVLSLAHSTSPF